MLVTLDEMKNYLAIPLADTTQDEFLTFQISKLSEAIEAYCARKFELAEYKETFYRDEYLSEMFRLKNEFKLYVFPVKAVSQVFKFESETDLVGEEITDYRVHKPTGILKRTTRSSSWFEDLSFRQQFLNDLTQRVEVTYEGGYEIIPLPIKNVVFEVVATLYNKKKNGVDLSFGPDVQRISIPGVISLDMDYSLENNSRKIAFGTILGSHVNVLDYYRSERSVIAPENLEYLDVIPPVVP